MRQFDVFSNPSPTMRAVAPYVVVLSSHLLRDLTEVVVAPLVDEGHLRGSDFDVPVEFADGRFTVTVIGLAAIRADHLKERLGSLAAHEDDIRRALDRLFTGF